MSMFWPWQKALCRCVHLRLFISVCTLLYLLSLTPVSAPAKPTQKPKVVTVRGEVALVTHRTITIHKPVCFYSDDNGPIRHIQVIVAEAAGETPLQTHMGIINTDRLDSAIFS